MTKHPQFKDSWGMGDDHVRFKVKLPCLCPSGAEFVNSKFLYPTEEHSPNIVRYECLHCRTVISLTVKYLRGEVSINSKTEMGKNKNKLISPAIEKAARDFYRMNVTKEVIERMLGVPKDNPDDPKNWEGGWKI